MPAQRRGAQHPGISRMPGRVIRPAEPSKPTAHLAATLGCTRRAGNGQPADPWQQLRLVLSEKLGVELNP
jgi:hypothetical protein